MFKKKSEGKESYSCFFRTNSMRQKYRSNQEKEYEFNEISNLNSILQEKMAY